MKKVTLLDFLTREEIEEARNLKVAREIRNKIIAPNIERINKALGQENNTMYLAYMVEYVINLPGLIAPKFEFNSKKSNKL